MEVIPIDNWNDLCLTANNEYADASMDELEGESHAYPLPSIITYLHSNIDPAYVTRAWDAFPTATRIAIHNGCRIIVLKAQALDNLNNINAGQEPDTSDFQAFSVYAKLHGQRRVCRRELIRACAVLDGVIEQAVENEYLDDELGDFLSGWAKRHGSDLSAIHDQTRENDQRLTRLVNDVVGRRMAGDPNTDWVKGKVLGSGTFGEACVWLRQNSDGVITDVSILRSWQRGLIADSGGLTASDH